MEIDYGKENSKRKTDFCEKGAAATKADKQVVTDLMDTLRRKQRNLCRHGGQYDWSK